LFSLSRKGKPCLVILPNSVEETERKLEMRMRRVVLSSIDIDIEINDCALTSFLFAMICEV
jgi:hypothetical protein